MEKSTWCSQRLKMMGSLSKLTRLKSAYAVVQICRFTGYEVVAKCRKLGSLEGCNQLVLDKGGNTKTPPYVQN